MSFSEFWTRGLRVALLMAVLYTSPAAALQEWHQTISPATFDFFTQENGTADLHLDPSVVASGITVE